MFRADDADGQPMCAFRCKLTDDHPRYFGLVIGYNQSKVTEEFAAHFECLRSHLYRVLVKTVVDWGRLARRKLSELPTEPDKNDDEPWQAKNPARRAHPGWPDQTDVVGLPVDSVGALIVSARISDASYGLTVEGYGEGPAR